jgi:predicted dehydrogenase
MAKIKIVVSGLGHAAINYHLPCLSRFEDVDLCLCDAWEAPRERAGNMYGIPQERIFTDHHKMLEEFKPDGIYVLMPQYEMTGREPTPYESYVVDVLEHGIPLFVEKPLGVDSIQARRITDVAKQYGVKTTMSGFQNRFNPLLRHAMNLIADQGGLLNSSFSFFKGTIPNNSGEKEIVDYNWLTYGFIHALDLACWVPGDEIAEVTSSKLKHPTNDKYYAFDAFLRFRNNRSSHFMGNAYAGGRLLRFELHGNGISIFITSSKDELPSEGHSCGYDMTALIFRMDPGSICTEPEIVKSGEVSPVKTQYGAAGFWGQSRHFVDCVREHTPTESSFESALKTIEVCDQILNH